ncbi:DNA polymerase [Stygiobacter electus]|uniref:DNA polymerase n=1 Tax=Stygiobacter electus TaxID=3032292 RepID=A0AAE3TCU6_9BACT|nr:DNA polymerase [Stygiobacter electus]MDF1612300.1 DNA polymerase [Stygiobacter electus]
MDIINEKEKTDSKNPPILPIKLAGVIFSVFITTIENKKNDEVIIREPNNLYQIANLDSRTFKKGTDLLLKHYQVKSLYRREKIYIKNSSRYRNYTIRSINNYKSFLDKVIKIHNKYFSRMSTNLNLYNTKLYISSGVNFHEHFNNFDEIKYAYETKYIRDRSSKFNFQAMENNPFLRIYKIKNNYHIYSQYYLLNYLNIFYSLYTKRENDVNVFKFSELNHLLTNKFKLNNKQINRLLNYYHLNKSFKIFKKEFKDKKLLINKRMISNFNDIDNKGAHFEQILECISYVNKLSQEGIPINIKKAKSLLYTNKNEEAVCFNFETGKYKEENLAFWLKEIINNSKNNLIKDNVITGYFMPHGAKTHRMTCHKLNLQGIPKKIKNEIFSPITQDEIILSMDISGQDIVVSANLAKKLYNDNEIKQYFSNQKELQELQEKIEKTLKKLSISPSNRPTDYLKSLIKQYLKKNYTNFQYFINDESEIKDLIKKCIYINFYGGTKNTFIKGLKESQNSRTEIDKKDNNLMAKISKSEIKDFLNKFYAILEKQNINVPKPGSQVYNDPAKIFYEKVINIIKSEYPGILESLEIYYTYSIKNNNISYPTLLGWQTIIEDPLSFRKKDLFTKSKSYPIQASGAEFIRQWLIEANKKNNGEFRIINVVHDQLLLLLNKSNINKVKSLVHDALKIAASKTGIIPETINVNYEEYNYNG